MQKADLRSSKTAFGDLAYKALVKGIISHELKPGDNLYAKELAELLGISRTPVERALERLTGEGLVEFEPGMCPRVFVPTPGEVLELYDISALLEAHAVEQSIDRVNDQFLGELDGLLKEYEASLMAGQARGADYEAQLSEIERDR